MQLSVEGLSSDGAQPVQKSLAQPMLSTLCVWACVPLIRGLYKTIRVTKRGEIQTHQSSCLHVWPQGLLW